MLKVPAEWTKRVKCEFNENTIFVQWTVSYVHLMVCSKCVVFRNVYGTASLCFVVQLNHVSETEFYENIVFSCTFREVNVSYVA